MTALFAIELLDNGRKQVICWKRSLKTIVSVQDSGFFGEGSDEK